MTWHSKKKSTKTHDLPGGAERVGVTVNITISLVVSIEHDRVKIVDCFWGFEKSFITALQERVDERRLLIGLSR